MNRIHFKNIYAGLFTAVLIILISVSAKGYKLFPMKGNDVCLACHEDPNITMERGGKKVSIYVNPAAFKKSVHSSIECTDCHVNYNPDDIPHTKTRSAVDCRTCHDDPKVKEIDNNVHKNVKCADCHSKHEIIPAKDFAKEQTSACLTCHTNKNVQAYRTSIHAEKKNGCESCHTGGHNVKAVTKNDAESTCGKCHGQHQKNFNNSIHETVLKSGNKNAPTCTDCHGSHRIVSSKMSIQSESCLKCHLDPKLFPGEGKGSAKFVAEYKTSIHASLMKNGQEAATCSDCHGNHQIQNPDNPQASTTRTRLPETCGKCHKDIMDKFLGSAHGKALLGKSVAAPTCVDCHSEHSIKAVRQSDEFSKINQVDLCLKCHQEQKLPHKNYKGEEVLISDYKNSYHYKALQEGKLNAATCSDCHGSHEMKKFDDPTSRIYKENIAQTCGQSNCHTKQLNEYTGSIHEVSLKTKPNSDAPTCTNCHGNHQILQKSAQSNLISNSKGLVQLCSSCHASVELVKKYNLPTGRAETYLGSFHGLAVQGGSKIAANCESCHGNHNIRPSSDTLSTINKKNLPETCGKCHPGAIETLFNTPIHITNQRVQSPMLYWVSKFYLFLILLIIGGMVIHNAVDFTKKVKRKNSKPDEEKA